MIKTQIRPSRTIRSYVLVTLVAAIGSAYGPALAQPQTAPSAPAPASAAFLTLRDAAQLAVTANPEVLARWHTIQAAQGERDAARGGLLPRVDLTLAKGREQGGELATGSRSANSLSLTQLLYDGFATRNEIRRLDHAARVRMFEFFDTSETVALEAVRAYVDVVRYRELVRLAEDNFVEHQAVFSQTDQRVKARVAPSVDLEQVAGRRALAQSNLLTETANLHDTTARFQRVIGRLPSPQAALPGYLLQEIPADATTALTRVQQRHGGLQASIENVRAANAALAARKGASGPRVDFRLRKDHGSRASAVNGNTSPSAAEVVLSWNLFNGFSDQARERQFAEQVNVAKDLRDKTCRDTRQTLMIAYNDVSKLREQLDYLALHEASTARALTAYRLQFSIGQRTLLSLLDTENELFQARRAVVNARQDLHFGYARTQAGMGNLLRALELTSLATDRDSEPTSLAEGESPQDCPAEPVMNYAADKDALVMRASQLARRTAPVVSPAVSPVVPAAATLTVATAPALAVPASADSQKAGIQAVTQALQAWRSAWAERDVATYLQSYAPGFAPPKGLSRAAWEANRRNVIARSTGVSIGIDEIVVQHQDQDHATTVFRQAYRSASYRDQLVKTIRWERINNRWLIVQESTTAP